MLLKITKSPFYNCSGNTDRILILYTSTGLQVGLPERPNVGIRKTRITWDYTA